MKILCSLKKIDVAQKYDKSNVNVIICYFVSYFYVLQSPVVAAVTVLKHLFFP